MPTRMIRESLLESDRFLNLPDNTARICYIALLLTADDRGNLEASSGRLVRLWRDFGVDSNQKAASISQFLADQDLIRLYDTEQKSYIHVPRFGQRLRNFKRSCPPSPWCETQTESTNSSEKRQQIAATRRKSPPEVEEKRSRREEIRTTARQRLRGCRLTNEWVPPEDWVQWACELTGWERSRAYRAAIEFRDYWVAVPGQRGVKLDWEATWRNRVRALAEREGAL